MIRLKDKGAAGILILILAANIFGCWQASAQPVSDIDESTSEDSIIQFLGIDPTAYPKIKVSIFVDELCAATGGLVKNDFTVEEDGNEVPIDNFYFTGRALGQKLDLAVVFDETDTMADEIDAMQFNVYDMTNKIKSSNIDARYSLVTFKTEVLPKIEWTVDADIFNREVGKLRAFGGNYQRPEDSLGGVAKALSFGFRPDAQKIIIVITDEPSIQRGDGWSNSTYLKDDVETDLLNAGVMLVAVSPNFSSGTIPSEIPISYLPLYADMKELALDSGGLWIDIYSANFTVILDQLEEIITGNYVIEYTSPGDTATAARTVSVSVYAPKCIRGDASSSYIAPASATAPNEPPIIIDLTSDKMGPQVAGEIITWSAEAEDPDGDQVLYKYFLNDVAVTDWTTDRGWTWTAPFKGGSYRIEAYVRDGKHAGPNGMDDRKRVSFDILGDDLNYRLRPYGEVFRDRSELSTSDADIGYHEVEVDVRDGTQRLDGDDYRSREFDVRESETWFVEFNRTFGGSDNDSEYSVWQTSDGGYIIIGKPDSDSRGWYSDIWVIKTDSRGNEELNKLFVGSSLDWSQSIWQTPDGGRIDATGGRGADEDDIKLIKTDSRWNEEWSKTFGGPGSDWDGSVWQTYDGGYIVACTTDSYGAGEDDVWLIKTDSLGNEEWNKTFGGSSIDFGSSVQQTSDGGFIIAATTAGDTYSSARLDVWLIKTDSGGNEEWSKTFGGSGSDWGDSARQTYDGGYIVAGRNGAGEDDIWLIKTDSLGNEEWNRTFDGSDIAVIYSVHQVDDGGYIITGIPD